MRKSNPKNPVRRRELGDSERLFTAWQNARASIASQTLHIDGWVNPQTLRRALDIMPHRYPLTGARIDFGKLKRVPGVPYLFRRAYFDLDGALPIPLTIIDGAGPTKWAAVVRSEIETPFEKGRHPHLRVTLVRQDDGRTCHVTIAKDHAIADFRSGGLLAHHLMRILSGEYLNDDNKVVPGLPPALETLDWTSERAKPNSPYQPALNLPRQDGRRGRRRTDFIEAGLSNEETASLFAAVRRNKVSLHGAVMAAFLQSLRDRYGISTLTLLSSADLRRLRKPQVSDTTFGCYIDLIRTKHELDIAFWKLARNIKFALVRSLVQSNSNASVLKYASMRICWAERAMLLNGMRMGALAGTTTDRMPLRTNYGTLNLTNITNVQSLSGIGTSLFVVATTFAGALKLTICYPQPLLIHDEVEDISMRAIAALVEEARSESVADS